MLIACRSAAAQEAPEIQYFESWSGVTASENVAFAYGGLVAAPFGRITEDGLRLRLEGGGGLYAYDGQVEVSGETADIRFLGQSSVTALLVGYQQKLGGTIVKAYGGAVYDVRRVIPLAPGMTQPEPVIGAKLTVELWHDWAERAWSSLDLVYETPFDSYQASGRAGWRVLPSLSLGIEAGVLGNEDYEALRAGLLVKWDTNYGDLMLSGGGTSDDLSAAEPYGGLSLLNRF